MNRVSNKLLQRKKAPNQQKSSTKPLSQFNRCVVCISRY